MDIKSIIILVLLFILIAIIEQSIKKNKPEENNILEYPYKQKYLLTKNEYKFYKTLKTICDQKQIIICPKVRLEDFIEVKENENKQKYRGYIKSRHIDFLLCDSNLYIKAGIELDDTTHNTSKAQKTNELKNNIFKAIDIPLYRIKVNDKEYTTEIENIIKLIYN